MSRLSGLLLAALVLAACDTDTPDPVAFQGVDIAAEGEAILALQGGALVVSGLDGSRAGGFQIDGQPDRVDVEIDPLSIPVGGRFGVEVRDGDAVLASLYNEATAAGRFDVRFDFPDAIGATAAIVRYRLNGEVRFEGQVDLIPGRTSGQRQPTSGGSGEGDTGSTHVIRERGRYVVVSDSGEDAPRRAGGCAGFLMTPPPPFAETGQAAICADWIEIEPVLTTTVRQGTMSVLARGVGSFTVRSLEAQ